jgi:hypothetical protein
VVARLQGNNRNGTGLKFFGTGKGLFKRNNFSVGGSGSLVKSLANNFAR